MYRSVLITIALFCSYSILGQVESKNNYTGSWDDAGSWQVSQPTYNAGEVSNSSSFDIYGYITRPSSLTFANLGNNNFELVVRDTLVIQGDLTFQTNAVSLSVPAGGLLVVFGSFSSANKVEIANGGTIAVTENFTVSGGQGDYLDSSTGGLYVDGTVTGDAGASADQQPISDLNGSTAEGEQDLFDFIVDEGATLLPIKLGSFEAHQEKNAVVLEWETVSEDNFSHFEIYRVTNHGRSIMAEIPSTLDPNGDRYYLIDETPQLGLNIYQIQSVDFDGYREWFEPVTLVFQPQDVSFQLYPNSGRPEELATDIYEEFALQVYNLAGRKILETTVKGKDLSDLRGLEKGSYIFRYNINGHLETQRMIIR